MLRIAGHRRFIASSVAIFAIASCSQPPSSNDEDSVHSALTDTSESDAGTCTRTRSERRKDIDPTDYPETPWRKDPATELTVYFEDRGAGVRYWPMVEEAARIWSRSECLEAIAVPRCPSSANCVSIQTRPAAPGEPDTDGEFEGVDGRYRTGGTITLFTNLMDTESDQGALATVVHELGHAIGLVHRLNPNDVMHAETDDTTSPIPDAIDFDNLRMVYGTVQ